MIVKSLHMEGSYIMITMGANLTQMFIVNNDPNDIL
jgi:hypothetical protein